MDDQFFKRMADIAARMPAWQRNNLRDASLSQARVPRTPLTKEKDIEMEQHTTETENAATIILNRMLTLAYQQFWEMLSHCSLLPPTEQKAFATQYATYVADLQEHNRRLLERMTTECPDAQNAEHVIDFTVVMEKKSVDPPSNSVGVPFIDEQLGDQRGDINGVVGSPTDEENIPVRAVNPNVQNITKAVNLSEAQAEVDFSAVEMGVAAAYFAEAQIAKQSHEARQPEKEPIAPDVMITESCLGKRRDCNLISLVIIQRMSGAARGMYPWVYVTDCSAYRVTNFGHIRAGARSPDDIVEIYPLPTTIDAPCPALRAGGGELTLQATEYPGIFEYQEEGQRVLVYRDGRAMTEKTPGNFCRIPGNDIVEIWPAGLDIRYPGVRLPRASEQVFTLDDVLAESAR